VQRSFLVRQARKEKPHSDQIQNLQIKGTNQATVMTKQKSNFQDHKLLFLSFPNIKLV
jgi:hypothetical protein